MPSIKTLASTAFTDAAPYLQNADWLKETFNTILEKTESFEQLEKKLKEETVKENDAAKKADLKIYLVYLGKAWRKRIG